MPRPDLSAGNQGGPCCFTIGSALFLPLSFVPYFFAAHYEMLADFSQILGLRPFTFLPLGPCPAQAAPLILLRKTREYQVSTY